MKRIPYQANQIRLSLDYNLILKKGKNGERRIKASKWYINRNTPVGEDAEFWERKPYGGKKQFYPQDIIAIEEP